MKRAYTKPGKVMILSPARELMDQIRSNTARGFAFSMSFFILIFVVYFAIISSSNSEIITAPIDNTHIVTTLGLYDIKTEIAPPVIPNNPKLIIGSGMVAGNPIPIPETDLKEIDNVFASVNEIHRSLSVAGDVIGDIFDNPQSVFDDGKTKIQIESKIEPEPDPEIMLMVDKEPGVDLPALQKSIVYPHLARESGTEGKVVVMVLVGKYGKPEKAKITYSSSLLLEEAAIKAVMNATYTPAIMHNNPVKCWVNIPITFSLK